MGTRALILKNGKKWVFTHWDGYPDELGKLLCKLRGKSEGEKLKILHKKHTIDRYCNYHGGEAFVITDDKKSFKRLKYKPFKPSRSTDWLFDYTYNITRSGVFYTKSFYSEKEITKTNINTTNWKKVSC